VCSAGPQDVVQTGFDEADAATQDGLSWRAQLLRRNSECRSQVRRCSSGIGTKTMLKYTFVHQRCLCCPCCLVLSMLARLANLPLLLQTAAPNRAAEPRRDSLNSCSPLIAAYCTRVLSTGLSCDACKACCAEGAQQLFCKQPSTSGAVCSPSLHIFKHATSLVFRSQLSCRASHTMCGTALTNLIRCRPDEADCGSKALNNRCAGWPPAHLLLPSLSSSLHAAADQAA
jgi:hypothetical protein